MLCAEISPKLEVAETHTRSWAFHVSLKTQQSSVKASHGKRDEGKQHVVQCVRESHREPDEEHSTHSRPEVTMLFQF